MKLLMPTVLHELERGSFSIDAGLSSIGLPRNSKQHQRLARYYTPLLHQAEKFIFDSGSDRDGETTRSIRETAVEMMHAGMFRLPYRVTWIEDPFEDGPSGSQAQDSHDSGRETSPLDVLRDRLGHRRYFYLCTEEDAKISIRLFHYSESSLGSLLSVPSQPAVIDLNNPSDDFHDPYGKSGPLSQGLHESVYGLKKFLVTLATEQAERAHVPGKAWRTGAPKRSREYEHTIVRVPYDRSADVNEPTSQTDGRTRPRQHLVRGYVWGRNTRPVEQQRWIKPFFRGDASNGVAPRSHYEVGA